MKVDPKAGENVEAAIDLQEQLYREITCRLQPIVPEQLDDLSAIALMNIITWGRIVFRDGFVLNGNRLEENIMGIGDAADIMFRTNVGNIGRESFLLGVEELTTSN